MNNVFKIIAVSIIAFGSVTLVACNEQTPKTKITQAQKAAEAANSITFTANAEIENIKKRLELTSDPGLIGFVVLINRVGSPVLYTPTKGKVTSGGKRLTPSQQLKSCDKGEARGDCVMKAPSDEGTHGSSNPYNYFFSTSGQYYQTNMEYLFSDQPFRLTEQPLVVVTQEANPTAGSEPTE